jgi:hypothetical protein
MGDARDELDDDTIIEAIRAGVMAGSYGYWARKEPEAARGLNRMRAKESAASQAAITEFLARRCNAGPSVVSGPEKTAGTEAPASFREERPGGRGDGANGPEKG